MVRKDRLGRLVGRTPFLGDAARSVYTSSAGRRTRRLVKKMLVRLGVVEKPEQESVSTYPTFSSAGPIPASVQGTVRISLFGGSGATTRVNSDAVHRHTWVKGPDYSGTEDNDIRGFVDGRYVAGWNQPGQVHVRIGRKPTSWARYGDCELFRVLHRWDDIWLPAGSTVTNARFEIEVENGVDRDLEIMLYEVKKDWGPGKGGLERNNNSAPAEGEVWWNEVAHKQEPWGLPGAGFASDVHPNADTPEMPLAIAHYRPNDPCFAFESDRLTDYVDGRVRRGEPLLFLVKLSDYLEDIPGTSIDVYSSNHGDNRNSARRPRLTLEWTGGKEVDRTEIDLILEHGRSYVIEPEQAAVEGIAISFLPAHGAETPTVHMRGDGDEDWQSIRLPRPMKRSPGELRFAALVNPVPIGTAFTAAFRDTWVPSGPPEEQEVRWVFVSPSGERHERLAHYSGDSRWAIEFEADELGRWQYQWFHHFTKTPYESPVGQFDVIPGNRDNALQAMKRLTEESKSYQFPPGKRRGLLLSTPFNRLLRAVMRYETPDSFPLREDDGDGGRTGELLDDARAEVGGVRPNRPRLDVDYPKGVER